ncbi:MAG: sigma-70 family RNA polymerase sigma factor [Acidobacteria bacterium]|nr:sigma-70 family RNA polymerase sigma factor [Acidobacteriota bacterium]
MALFATPTGPPDEDAGLARRLKGRMPGAFEELLAAYQGPIYGFVYRLLDDPSEAPDVTQEIFLKVFRKVDGFRGDCTLKTWIYRIAVHEASNRRRWFSRWRKQELSVDHDETWNLLRDPSDTPFESLRRREQSDLIDQALRGVDERLRTAVVMRDLQGLSYNEIADALEISLGTVKSRILRGREALKSRLSSMAAEGALSGVSYQAE